MLKVTKRQYEIEEQIQGIGNDDEILYEFTMQITSEELQRINEIIINEESIKLAKKSARVDGEEKEEIEAKILEIATANQTEFECICFKDHKEPFIKAVGEYKYLEMVELLFDFFIKAFLEKKTKTVDTMNTYLHKISGK